MPSTKNNERIKLTDSERMVLEMLQASLASSLSFQSSVLLSGLHRTLGALTQGKLARATSSLSETCAELSEKE